MLALNNKQTFRKVCQLPKGDQYLPDYEDEQPNDIPSEQKNHQILTHELPLTNSNYKPHELSIRKEDIGNILLTQLLNLADLKKLTYFSLDLTNLLCQESSFLLLSTLLSKLTNLKCLDLIIHDNQIKDAQAKQFSLDFQIMKELQSLKFSISKCFTQETQQTFFTLQFSRPNPAPTSTQGFEMFYSMLVGFKKLQQLEFTIIDNNFSNNEMISLSKSFNNLVLLTSLILRIQKENIDSQYFETMITPISKMILLQTLELSFTDCNLGTSQCSCIFFCISPLINLQNLKIILESNGIEKNHMLSMAKKFKNLKKLQTIRIYLPSYSSFPGQEEYFEEFSQVEYEYYVDFPRKFQTICKRNAISLVSYQLEFLSSLKL